MTHTGLSDPQVSVIIPTYNRAHYICQTIESALSQAGVRTQVIVVDDGSTDDTARAVAPYLDRIIYVRQSNQGTAAARNHGLRLAQADYVAFQDSDDYYLPGVLKELHTTLAARPALGAVQGGLEMVDATGQRLRVEQPWHDAPKLDMETGLRLKPVYLTAMLVRKEWANRVDGFDVERWAADVDFFIRLVAAGCAIEWLHRSISCYRRHAGNMTCDAIREVEDLEAIHDKYFARADVSAHLRRQEATIRFYNMAWGAWRMSCTGQTDQIAPWLTRSLAHTPYTDDETLLAWLKLFAEHDALVGRATEGSAVWLPSMRVAAQSLQLSWAKTEALLVWWVEVWSHYLEGQEARALEGLAEYRNVSLNELLTLAQDSLLSSPENKSVALIDRFWADAEALGLVSASQRSSTVSLYLTAFGQAALAHHYAVAWRALRRAVRSSRRPATVFAWLRFMRKAILHVSQRFTGLVNVRETHDNDEPTTLAPRDAAASASPAAKEPRKAMRICLVVESLSDFGGLEEIMTELAVALRQRGHQISVVSTVWVQPDSQYKRTLKDNGIMLVQWPFMPFVRTLAWAWVVLPTLLRNRSWSRAIEAKRHWEYKVCENAGWMYETSKYNTPCFRRLLSCWCRIWRPDLIHIHSFVHELNLMHIVDWTHSRGIPTVFEEHQTPDPTGPRWDDFRRHINSATMVGAVSQKAMQVMRDGLGVERPITVLPPIVADPGTFKPVSDKQEPQPDPGPKITTIARLIPEKGLPYLFEAVADLRKTYPKLQFRLFGDGPSAEYTMEVTASAQRFGLDTERDFAGTYLRRDLGNIMEETDIFVLPSLTEGLPLTVVEAMAFGRPIVATAVGGIPDVLEDGVNALLCPPRNPASLATALRRLLESPDECTRLGNAARRSFEQGPFHPDEACRQYVSMYEQTLRIAGEASCN